MSLDHRIILYPSVTEKNTSLRMNQNKYVFEVLPTATKPQIRSAVEFLFKVKVESVNTVRLPGKRKRMGKHVGFRPDRKKAIVQIQKGQTISQFGGV